MPDCIPHSSLPSTYREDKGIPLYYTFKADEKKFHFKSESQVQKGKDRLRDEKKRRRKKELGAGSKPSGELCKGQG